MPISSGLDYHLKMSLEEGTSSQLTQDPTFRDLTEKVDKLVQALEASNKNIHDRIEEIRRELAPHTIKGF